ncbi:hypothetical protein, unlikely [Trypanosoma brucei gambiense DAL972]|uniref:Uncharacterized protein n=3 Tax=Trypanosoma brucei TaxID=5691 RepID=Q4GYM6_TRYB2|nr:hypothetical protein, unlikely [Trypanosoma brucei brucei TREU927]XP_011771498.1 hypothetical protein, unlikely [Trypanosoma brucei gambiense DAL972]RHW74452.1 hypothetical protein DPX39_010035600 [Trypanosoma brucei equiperdum]CAJ16558.1 hypothetical protein, unlikely [Trypanosoma brucei brucei TREU927]CBH09057.1 hypothetical protein, unlikely [Trypanosoma brucei gambiense DAL972]|eukprot:XP_011771498.1 hypothetical protein, unlikely [Trypanosoma brucei gambiense DAL972]
MMPNGSLRASARLTPAGRMMEPPAPFTAAMQLYAQRRQMPGFMCARRAAVAAALQEMRRNYNIED